MTERENVIKGLEELEGFLFKEYTNIKAEESKIYYNRFKSLSDAINILKEQKPVKPNLDVDEWICGNCCHKLEHQELLGDNMLFHEQYNYCPNCGKKVKWE